MGKKTMGLLLCVTALMVVPVRAEFWATSDYDLVLDKNTDASPPPDIKRAPAPNNNQQIAGIAVTAETPIYGIQILPPTDGKMGLDPASVSAVPAE